LRSPPTTVEQITSWSTFVLLQNGMSIQLNGCDDSSDQSPIRNAELPGNVTPDNELEDLALNKVVKDVVISPYLPYFSIALLLDDHALLCYRDHSPFQIGGLVMSPSDYGGSLVSYWGHRKIDL